MKFTLGDKINAGLISTTALVVVWVFSTFASASDLEELKRHHDEALEEINVDIWYGQFYDRLDDFDEANDEGNDSLAQEYARQMERLRAKICEVDPEWERCEE